MRDDLINTVRENPGLSPDAKGYSFLVKQQDLGAIIP